MIFGSNRHNQDQERLRRQRESDLIELEDTLGDIADEFGLDL